MDILYPLKPDATSQELLFSIRSLENIKHDKLVFVGGYPNNIKRNSAIHIQNRQTGTKWQNSKNNIRAACQDIRLSDDFILMNDDFFILQQIDNPNIQLNLHRGTLKDVCAFYNTKLGNETQWCRGMRETGELLVSLGIKQPLCYELHIPMVMNKQKVLQLFALPGINKIASVQIRSLYGNLYLRNSKYCNDVKVLTNGVFDQNNANYKMFLSCSDGSFSKVKDFLANRFSKKSKYEL